MLVVPQVGNAALLEILRTQFVSGPPRVQLYQNDYSPTLTDVVANYTPATFPGYTSKILDFSQPPIDDGTGHLVLEAERIEWQATADPSSTQRVFGYFVTDGAGTTLWWAERFPNRIFFRKAGNTLATYVRFGGLSEFSG